MKDNWTEQLKSDLASLSESMGKPSAPPERLRAGERRETAILFLDLSGFTRLSEQLDHEQTHRLANSLMGALGMVAEAHGGYVDKIEGDRIMALFGARASGENDCIRAVACGLRMLRVIEEVHSFLARRGDSISARVGVSYGSVTVAPDAAGHLTAMGDEVNLGSRMQEMAPVGSMLVSQRVRRVCGEGFEWRDAGELAVRGRSSSVHAWEPLGVSRLGSGRWITNPLLGRVALAGREPELASLRNAFDRGHREGSSVFVWVTGEAGIGKSRLVHDFLKTIEPGTMILRGRTLSFAQPPYWFWTQIVRGFFSLEGDPGEYGRLETGLRAIAGPEPQGSLEEELREHLPALAEITLATSGTWLGGDLDQEKVNLRIRLSISFFLELLTKCSPGLVIFIDDAHWLDAASMKALLYACRSGSAAGRFSVIAASRGDEGSREIAQAFPGGRFERVALAPLDEAASTGIVSDLLGCPHGEIPNEALKFLLSRAQGIPYYLEELLMDILDRGILSRGRRGWTFTGGGDLPVPPTVAGIITARFDRLPEGARRALSVSSVFGQTVVADLLADTMGVSLSEAEQYLDLLVHASFLQKSGESSFTFRSGMARQAVHDMILMHNRMVLHHKAAEAIVRLRSGDLERFSGAVAWHEFRAARKREALEWGIRMVDTLYRGYQHNDVMEWSGTLRGWLDDIQPGSEHDSILLRVSRLECRSAEYLSRRSDQERLYAESLELARRLGDIETVVTVLMETGIMKNNQGRYPEARRILEESLEMAVANSLDRHKGRAMANIGMADAYMGDLASASIHFNQAMEIFEELGDLHDIGVTLQNLAYVTGQKGDYEESRRILQRALEIHSSLSPYPRGEAVVLHNLGVYYALKDDIPTALEYYRKALALQRQLGNRKGEGASLGNIACCLKDLGQRDEAHRTFLEAIAINGETGNLRSMANTLMNLASLHEDDDDLQAAGKCYSEALEASQKGGFMVGVLSCRCHLARLSLKEGLQGSLAEYASVTQAVEESGISEGFMPSLRRLRDALAKAGCPPEELRLPGHWKSAPDQKQGS